MNIKGFFNFEQKIIFESPISYEQFIKCFKNRCISNKNNDFNGDIENNKFTLCISRGIFNIKNFSKLNATIHKKETGITIVGNINISDDTILLFVLGIITLPIFIVGLIISGEFHFEYLGIFGIILIGIFIVINLQLYLDKREYINEIKTLSKLSKQKNANN